MPSAELITATVNRYIELVNSGSADDLADLYASDATVEDPVGGEVHIGRGAIHGFYANVRNLDCKAELVTLRVAGHEAAFVFKLVVGGATLIEPIDVMVFDGEGKIAAMKSYWGPDNISQL